MRAQFSQCIVISILILIATCLAHDKSEANHSYSVRKLIASRQRSLHGKSAAALRSTQFKPGKAVEGTPRPKPTPVPSPTPIIPEPERDPVPRHGPADLLQELADTCLPLRQGSYKYELCPFRNITQLDVSGTSPWGQAPFFGILGLFRGWRTAISSSNVPPPLPTPRASRFGGRSCVGNGDACVEGGEVSAVATRWNTAEQLDTLADRIYGQEQ